VPEATALDPKKVGALVRLALDEDLGSGDVTSEAIVGPEVRGSGILVAKEGLVVAGLDVARAAFQAETRDLHWEALLRDGDEVSAGAVLVKLAGHLRGLLRSERVALNFLQRMSGIATTTRRFVEAVQGMGVRIRDTRKTTPLLRALEKYAVRVGGGASHRAGLDGAILVKDNHVRFAGSVREATRRVSLKGTSLELEVEVEREDQIEEALEAGAHMILLDNFTPEEARLAVLKVSGRVPVEVSGGIRLDNARAFAESGARYLAVGALTHSARAVDISLEIEGSD